MHTTDLIPWPITWHSLPKIGHIYICIYVYLIHEVVRESCQVYEFSFSTKSDGIYGVTPLSTYTAKTPRITSNSQCVARFNICRNKRSLSIKSIKGIYHLPKESMKSMGDFFHPGCLECDHCFQIDTIAMLVLCKFSIMAAHVLVFLQRRCDRGLQGLLVLVQLLADWIRPVLHQFLLQFYSLGKRIGVDMVFKD